MKLLLFSNDLMPFGELPTSGGGLRCWQLMRGLQAHGIEVVASMPGFTYLTEKHFAKIPAEQRELLWQWGTQDEILRRTKPDAVLFASNWDHFNLSGRIDVPLIIDLHGSRLIETTMFNDPVSSDRKVSILGKADCLLTAGTRQRTYFYGWLLQAGRVPKEEHFIRYIPVSLSPEQPQRIPSDDADLPRFVSGGGWFPWQNQAKAIFAICQAVIERDRGSIEIYGTPHQTRNVSAEELAIREVYSQIESLAKRSDRIRVNGYVGRQTLLDVYRQASLAVEAMQYNLERELAFTTRTIEYLWCGLPVLYNDFGEISEHIREYDAGWAINPESDQEIAGVVDQIFSDPQVVEAKGRNASRLVRDRFSWDRTIVPLVEFLKSPKQAWAVEPAVGAMPSRASFLSPSGTAVDIPVELGSEAIEQSFVVPAENIKTVELAVALNDVKQRDMLERVELELRRRQGARLAKRIFRGSEIPVNGRLTIDFPLFRQLRGGAECTLVLRLVARSGADASRHPCAPLVVRGLLEGGYPFVSGRESSFRGRTLLGQEIDVQALALSFVPGAGRIYQLRSLGERIMWMIRQGQWGRLWRAGYRRIPGVLHRVRRAAFG